MTRGARSIAATLVVVVALAVGLAVEACASAPSGSLSTAPGPGATSSLLPPEEGSPESSGTGESGDPSAGVTSPSRGVVLHVDLAGLGKVTGFRILTSAGTQVDFKMGIQENAAEFPAAHLSEHVASAEPVLVYFRKSGPDLVVYRLEDAPAASSSP